MSSLPFQHLYVTVPACTNPRCPLTEPHHIAEFGFGASTYSSGFQNAFLRLILGQCLSDGLVKISLFELCHGGRFSFKVDAEGAVERVALCPHDCHATKQAELMRQAQRAGMETWDRRALLSFRCSHGICPFDTIVRGRFVRTREACPFSDLAIQQAMIGERDVFDDETMLSSRGQAVE